MAKYEMLYLLNNDATDEAKAAEIEKYETIVKSMNGSVESTDKCERKNLRIRLSSRTKRITSS